MHGFGMEGSSQVYRLCANKPTNKSIIGLLSAGLGYKRGSQKIQELEENVSICVETEKSGDFLVDMQTVHNYRTTRYDKNGKKETYHMKNVDGSSNKNPLLIHKEYRVGGVSFLVTVEGDDEMIEALKYAVRHPVYPLYLGKKCCIAKVYLLEDVKCRQKES